MTISQQIAKQKARNKQRQAAARKKFERAKMLANLSEKTLENLGENSSAKSENASANSSVASVASQNLGENLGTNANAKSSNSSLNSSTPSSNSRANSKTKRANSKANSNPNSPENSAQIQSPFDLCAVDENHQALVNKAHFYTLNCVVNFGALDEFEYKKNYKFRALAKFLGFAHICDDLDDFEDKKAKRKEVWAFFEEKFAHLSELKERGKLGEHKILQKNLTLLKSALNLSATELCLLEFIAIKNEVAAFSEFLEIYDDLSRSECAMVLSQIINAPYKELKNALGKKGILMSAGILDENSGRNDLSHYLRFDDDDFGEALLEPCKDKNALIDKLIASCGECALGKADYAHLKEFEQLQSYVAWAVAQGKSGVNVLLYGRAGTGKSELAKLLAQGAKAKLYRVKTSDADGDAVDGVRRFSSYLFAQRLLEPQKSLLLYDEAEDILHISHFDERMSYKAFVNEKLESNAVSTIWITNKISSVDEAVLRRFDFVVEAKVPKKEHKRRIINKICGNKLDEKAMKFAIKSKSLSPAIIERASKVSSALQGDFSSNFTMLAKNTLKASANRDFFWGKLKKKSKFKDAQNELPQSYSLDFINSNYDLESVANGIEKNPNARLCLYGASGTGKSAYARFIAQKLGRKCVVKTASDLLDCWVGNTEKLIAAAFKEAKKKNAVLVFDEVDSFLRDRSLATRSWEQTQVNEMLVQMEKFDGVFIATTNLMEGLDKASLRRFDLKLEFKFLTPTQRIKLFEKECEFLGIACEGEVLAKINRLEKLAAGDFAAVKRLIKFSPLKDALDFYERLADEVKVKDLNADTKAGFEI